MKRSAVISILAALFLLPSAQSFATSKYMREFKKEYRQARALHKCEVCHYDDGSDEEYPLNSYGIHFLENGRSVKAIEGLDSDGDGRTNIQEIAAQTWPGDASSFASFGKINLEGLSAEEVEYILYFLNLSERN